MGKDLQTDVAVWMDVVVWTDVAVKGPSKRGNTNKGNAKPKYRLLSNGVPHLSPRKDVLTQNIRSELGV